jgi:hypothetical protein
MEDDEKEFTHPGLRILQDEGTFQVLLPVKAARYRKLLHTVWFLAWMVGEVGLLASVFGWWDVQPPPLPVLIPFLAAFTAAGVFVLYRLLWYWAGREVFTVSDGRLHVRREFLGMGRTWRFERGTIRRLHGQALDYRVVYPSWGRMFIGHGEGEILVEGPSGTIAFAKGLEEAEAHALAGLLNEQLARNAREQRRPSELRAAR